MHDVDLQLVPLEKKDPQIFEIILNKIRQTNHNIKV